MYKNDCLTEKRTSSMRWILTLMRIACPAGVPAMPCIIPPATNCSTPRPGLAGVLYWAVIKTL